ncbi:MAG: DUF3575 domain-containing protein [Bacteroidales bacterium]|nr:DUF3575 domain-containing protein [Bacteroidales bacterium]
MRKVKHIGIFILMLVCMEAAGQKFSLSTNAVGYIDFCTFNIEGSYAVSRHWSVTAGARYNPFSFRKAGNMITNRQQAYAVGARFWPWHIYSGWWVAAKIQYQEYNTGGIISSRAEEGDRYGAGVAAGYTYMLHPRLNLELGLGVWAGMKKYTVYTCPSCGLTVSSGKKAFLMPNDIIIGISYVF